MNNLLIYIIKLLSLGLILFLGYTITMSVFPKDVFCDSTAVQISFLFFAIIIFSLFIFLGNKMRKNTEQSSFLKSLISVIGSLVLIGGIFCLIPTIFQLLATFAGWGC